MVDQVRLDFSNDCKSICHVGLVVFCEGYKSKLAQLRPLGHDGAAQEGAVHCRKISLSNAVTVPMVKMDWAENCDGAELVTKAKRPPLVCVYLRGKPRIYWLLWVMRLLIGLVVISFQ
jgi:hypothetical protein